jgi:lysophospholipase L1-like esterase
MGFRDVEHATVKQPGEFRILALGDSFTYGAGVSFNESYLSRLEQMLNSRKLHPKVEIIKAGVSRYYPEPERILLEHYGLKYSPDLIIVGFVPNDVLDANQGLDSIKIGQSGYLVTREGQNKPRIFTLFYTYSHVFRILFNKYNAMTNKEPPIKWDEVYRPNGVFEKDWRSIEVEYEKMLQLAKSAQARLIIVHIPQQGPWDDTKSYPVTRLSEWSSAHGAQFIDTLPAMKLADPQKSLYYAQDGHCRAAGYEVIAETVYRELTTRGLVP